MNLASRISHPASEIALPDDVVLSVRHVSKKFCRNLRRSMWYGMQDLAANLVGLRPKGSRQETTDHGPQTTDQKSGATNHEPSTKHQALSTRNPSSFIPPPSSFSSSAPSSLIPHPFFGRLILHPFFLLTARMTSGHCALRPLVVKWKCTDLLVVIGKSGEYEYAC
jgi:hypothetical protein